MTPDLLQTSSRAEKYLDVHENKEMHDVSQNGRCSYVCECSALISCCFISRISPIKKGKGLPQQAEVAQGVPGRLRPRIFLTFGTTRVVSRQPYAPTAFTPGQSPVTHF
jgi:hypothetical protein